MIQFYNKFKKPYNFNFALDNKPIKFEPHSKFLGTIVDSQLTWEEQITFLSKKVNKAYFAIKQLKDKLNPDSLLPVYYALFHSAISYNIVVWGRSSHVERVFISQKRVIRLIYNLDSRTSCREVFKEKNILTIACIYILKSLIYSHENKNKFPLHADIHTYNTRNKNNIYQNQHHHTFYEKSPFYAGFHMYNLLPVNLRDLPVHNFKKKLKDYLASNAFYTIGEFILKIQTEKIYV